MIKVTHRLCSAKVRHDNEGDAWASAAHQVGRTVKRLRVYHCQDCKGWHLTKRIAS